MNGQTQESIAKLNLDLKVEKPITAEAVEIIANSIYTVLRQEGCEEKDIIGVSSQLIGLVSSSFANSEKA